MSEVERQVALPEKLDLSGLQSWGSELAAQAQSSLLEYHDIFSLEKHEIGHTKGVEHMIMLKDPEAPPFKEHFCQIPPPQVESKGTFEAYAYAGTIHSSNSPWCNAVVLVRKKDGSLCFCINFRKLNALTRNDLHPFGFFIFNTNLTFLYNIHTKSFKK